MFIMPIILAIHLLPEDWCVQKKYYLAVAEK